MPERQQMSDPVLLMDAGVSHCHVVTLALNKIREEIRLQLWFLNISATTELYRGNAYESSHGKFYFAFPMPLKIEGFVSRHLIFAILL